MNQHKQTPPPRWAERLLEWFCPPDTLEEVQGDLAELYTYWIETQGKQIADRRYAWNALRLLRPFAKKKNSSFILTPSMIRNYLLIACRTILRHKAFSAINILGLALGLTGSLFIFLWVRDELSVDRYHANGPHLYRIMERQLVSGKRDAFPETRWPLPLEMPKKFPEVVHAAGFAASNVQMTFEVGERKGKEKGDWAGADWFHMLSIPLLEGSPQSALSSPKSLSISRDVALRYFGSPQAALGKTIRIDSKEDYQVSAVFENLPPNTVHHYDFLLSWDDFLHRNSWAKYWEAQNPQDYVQLRPDADVAAFEKKIRHFLRDYHRGIDVKQLSRLDNELFLQPFEQVYLYSKTENGEISGGRIEYVRILSMVAVFLVLIACINFTNLSTARSLKRAKEVGIRKVVGARRWGLISQFMGEAFLLTCMAVGVSLLLIALLLPTFNELTGKKMGMPFSDPYFGLALAGVVIVTSLLSGGYPSLLLSSLQPVQVLKKGLPFQGGASRVREGLVVIQFVISLMLLIGTFVVYRQMNYLQTKNLGFNRENVITVPLEGELLAKYPILKRQLEQMPGIESVSRMDNPPTTIGLITSQVDWTGKDKTIESQFTAVSIGYDLLKVLKMKLLEGREFSPQFSSDSLGYIINQMAARQIGYKNPVGQPLRVGEKQGRIIGVVEDFHFQALHEPIKPLIIKFGETSSYGYLLLRTQKGGTKRALSSLETICKEFNRGFPFSYSFLDKDYEELYKSERVMSKLINYFAFLTIFIACLGLLGLSSFATQQRAKEISIRKVLGSTVGSLVFLLAKDFLKLVLLSILIASPIAWYVLNGWLENYAYRIDIEWWVFLITGLLSVSIALVTVSFHSIKAALTNPVKTLRSE
jgi:ABC-type antimicrobial peptide transport system permease subunit